MAGLSFLLFFSKKVLNLLGSVINSFLEKKIWNQSFFVSQGKNLDNSVTQLMYRPFYEKSQTGP